MTKSDKFDQYSSSLGKYLASLVASFNNQRGDIEKLLKFRYSLKKEGRGEYSILKSHVSDNLIFNSTEKEKIAFLSILKDKKTRKKLKVSTGVDADFMIDYELNSQEPVLTGAIYPNAMYGKTILDKMKEFVLKQKIKVASPLSEILGIKSSVKSLYSRTYSQRFDMLYHVNNL